MSIKTKVKIVMPQNKILKKAINNDENKNYYNLSIGGKEVIISSEDIASYSVSLDNYTFNIKNASELIDPEITIG